MGFIQNFLNSVGTALYADDEIAIPALITEDVFHYAVHEGVAFEASTYNASASQFICFKTPNTNVNLHLLYNIASEGNSILLVYEDVTPAAGGSDQPVFNKNRASSKISGVIAGNTNTPANVQVGKDWTGGTLINPQGYFSSKNSSVVNASHELFLKQNSWYGFELNAIDSKDLGVTLLWFEVPNA